MQTTENKPQLLVAWSASSTDHRSDEYFPPFNKVPERTEISPHGNRSQYFIKLMLLKPLSSKQAFAKVLLAFRLTIIFLQVLKMC